MRTGSRTRWCRLLVAASIGAATALHAMPAGADPADLPAPAATANPQVLPGKIVFAALVTPDLIAAERFYSSLFGWQFTNAYLGRSLYGQASFNGRVEAAIVQKPGEAGQHPAWRTFVSSLDVGQSVQLAVAHGASVLIKPHPIAGLGTAALLADPQGAVIGVLTANRGDPVDTLAAPGDWIWSTLVAGDPEAEAAFYKTVFDYDTVELPDPTTPGHIILASQTFARASINPLPTDHAVGHPRWISYVRVSDMDVMIARATALGGRLVVPPHEDRNGGTIALVADPAGALFGLLEWSDDTETAADAAGDAK